MTAVKGGIIGAAILVCAGLLAGCNASSNSDMSKGLASSERLDGLSASEPAVVSTSTTSPGATGYKIGPLDVLDISVFKVPELSKSVQVADAGTINLPLVGEIPAGGMTAQEVERDLTKRLGAKYLQKPQVTVYVKEYNSQRVTVEGAVKKQGIYPIKGKNSLMQVIAMAEGLETKADSTVVVVRYTDGKRAAARFDINSIRNGETEDPPLQAGDMVVVGTSAIKESFENILKTLPLLGVFALLL